MIQKTSKILLVILLICGIGATQILVNPVTTNAAEKQKLNEIQWEYEDFLYEDNGKTITGFSDQGDSKTFGSYILRIPEGVTKIGKEAFKDEFFLEGVILSDTVIEIEEGAFADNFIETLVLGKSLKKIGPKAFQDNTISSLTIPNSVQEIGEEAFDTNFIDTLKFESKPKIGKNAFGSQYMEYTPEKLTFDAKEFKILENINNIKIPEGIEYKDGKYKIVSDEEDYDFEFNDAKIEYNGTLIINNPKYYFDGNPFAQAINRNIREDKYYKKEAYDWYIFEIGNETYEQMGESGLIVAGMDLAPYVKNNRTMLPISSLEEILDLDISYNNAIRTATFKKGLTTLKINIDTKTATRNNKPYELEVKPEIKENRLCLPVSVIGKAFNKTLSSFNEKKNTDIVWNQETQEVVFYKYK